jgi:hypothetical protein
MPFTAADSSTIQKPVCSQIMMAIRAKLLIVSLHQPTNGLEAEADHQYRVEDTNLGVINAGR